MRLVTRNESLLLDRQAQKLQIDRPDFYMDNAAREMSKQLSLRFSKSSKLLFLCGPGNNGGDGWAIARKLHAIGYLNIKIIYDDSNSTNLNQIKKDEFKETGLLVEPLSSSDRNKWKVLIQESDGIVDAIFGVGLSRAIQGHWKKIIEMVRSSKKTVIAIDIPSGLDATEGNLLGATIKAQVTLAVRPLKSGLFLNAGPLHAGKIVGIDVGFPKNLIRDFSGSTFLIGPRSMAKLVPHRSWKSNKTHFGHLGIIGGSTGMEGAAILAGLAALRAGSGYVTIFSDSPQLSARAPADLMVRSVDDLWIESTVKISAFVVGPGLSLKRDFLKIGNFLLKTQKPILLDAAGLEILKTESSQIPANWVMTPHAGEISRLENIGSTEIEGSRLKFTRTFNQKRGGVLVLKGFHTVVGFQGKNYIIPTGNPSLSKAGTGDVLAGIIGSYLGQGLSSEKAACLGAYQHGRAADLWIQNGNSVHSLLATDLIEMIKRL